MTGRPLALILKDTCSGRSLAIIAGLFQRLLRRTLHGALADERVRLGVGAHALARDASVSR